MKRTLCLAGLLLLINLVAAQGETENTDPDKIIITRLDALNSPARETNLSISPDGQYLYFMSTRGGQPWSSKYVVFNGEYTYDGDIWYSKREDEEWQTPTCLGPQLNTDSGEDEPMVSHNGRFITYQSWRDDWERTGGPYYRAELNKGQFTNSVGLGGHIGKYFVKKAGGPRASYATDGASMSFDGKTFLFCAGDDYDGDMDIYISKKVKGKWSKVKKLAVSTPYDERAVYIAEDGKTLYFASDGYPGYGGLDIYKTVLNDDGTCDEVLNIGPPFNTSFDDYGFLMTAYGEESYFIRDGDIYYAKTEKIDQKLKPGRVKEVKGEMSVNSRKVKIIFWDDNKQDGDTISLKIGAEYILQNQFLTNKKQSIEVELKRNVSEIVLHAENMGKFPPNTCALMIDDGISQQRIMLSSDLKTSEAVRIRINE